MCEIDERSGSETHDCNTSDKFLSRYNQGEVYIYLKYSAIKHVDQVKQMQQLNT